MKYVVHVAQKFKVFLVPVQSEEPKVHVLYSKCTKLLQDLMTKFLPTDAFMNDPQSGGQLSPKEKLLKSIKIKENYKVLLVLFSL